MVKTEPIKDKKEAAKLLNYYLNKGNYRNYLLIAIGLFTALRISDILSMEWGDVLTRDGKVSEKLYIKEKKTKKLNEISVNKKLAGAILLYSKVTPDKTGYIFKGRNPEKHLHRTQAYRIVKAAVKDLGLKGNISAHSLRKTVGYRIYEGGHSPILIMKIYNHSSFEITKRYLCIDQYEKDKVFMELSYF
ncbi:MAG: tyrosine-type recombinase/integrase [Clostridiales bacterium]|nr:tyrosine-type recombinase/integrase [Clostridiales bacterium]